MKILSSVWILITLIGCGGTADNEVKGKNSEMRMELSESECREIIIPSTVPVITSNYCGPIVGTGIVLDSVGHILTNAHLVSTYAPVLVQNPVTQKFDEAIITGSSPCDELAVIKVLENHQNYPPPTFGKSTELSTTDDVYICGYEMNNKEKTPGIPYLFQRTQVLEFDTVYDFYGLDNIIEIEAAPGHEKSGGPLINTYGEVVGIITIGLFDSTHHSHSIPIEKAQEIIPVLLDKNIKNIGAGFIPNDVSLAEKYGNPYMEDSLIIIYMEVGSPLFTAGWYKFDLLLTADGITLRKPGDLFQVIKSKMKGEEIKISGIGCYEDDVYRPYETTITVP